MPRKQEKRAERPRQNKNIELRYWLLNKKVNSKKAILTPIITNTKPIKYLKFMEVIFAGRGNKEKITFDSSTTAKFIPLLFI